MLKSRIRTQKKNPRQKCILILHNYQFCRALNKTIVFLVKHLSRMYDDKLYLFQTAKVYLETNVTGLHNILLCLSTNFLYAIYVQRECEIPGEHFQYEIAGVCNSCNLCKLLLRTGMKKLHLQQSCVSLFKIENTCNVKDVLQYLFSSYKCL